jgi:trimethylamine-N-oxide reductase cytochrome c-type subunit TorC
MTRKQLHVAGAMLGVVALAVTGARLPIRSADAQQFVNAASPLLDAAAGKAIGALGPGTAVDVAGQSGSATQVTVHGYSLRGSGAVVFVSPAKQIVEVSGFTGQATAGAAQTVGGKAYVAVTVNGWVASSALVPDVQTVWSAAASLYSDKCSACHALQPAKTYKANEWPGFMKDHAANAGLDPAQTALITAYLQTQSGT